MTDMARLFAALYVSEGWYDGWLQDPKRRLYWKARAVVLFDRVLCDDLRNTK